MTKTGHSKGQQVGRTLTNQHQSAPKTDGSHSRRSRQHGTRGSAQPVRWTTAAPCRPDLLDLRVKLPDPWWVA